MNNEILVIALRLRNSINKVEGDIEIIHRLINIGSSKTNTEQIALLKKEKRKKNRELKALEKEFKDL